MKFKSYNIFVNEKKHNWSDRFNKPNWDNNYVGAFGHTFNKIEDVPTIEDAEKILKERGIKYVERIEEFLETNVILISTGPERDETILLKDPFI